MNSTNTNTALSRFLVANSMVILVCVVYLVLSLFIASRKAFWNDELYTLYFSKLPVSPDLWRALSTGGDQIPPSFVVLTKLSTSLFGVNGISLRLPEIFFFLIFILCLYKIVSARTSRTHGLLAMIFPLATAAYPYAYEARPYALVLGFAAFGFYCWQSIDSGYRRLKLPGLAIALCGTVMSHYYGILVLFPFVIGEIVRTRVRHKTDAWIWVAFFAPLLPVLIFLPLIQGSMLYAATFWSKATWSQVRDFYEFLLRPVAVPLVFSLLLLTLFRTFKNYNIERNQQWINKWEVVAAFAFFILPVVSVVVAKWTGGALAIRHTLPAVIGVSLLFAFGLYYGASQRLARIITVFFFFGFLLNAYADFRLWDEETKSLDRTTQFLTAEAGSELPVVCWFSHRAMQTWYYAPKTIRDRVYYLADEKQSNRYLGHDTIDRGLLSLRTWFGLQNIHSYQLFVLSHPRFLLYYCSWGEDWRWNWIMSKLLEDGAHMEMKAKSGDQYLYLVTFEPRSGNAVAKTH